MGLVHAAGNVVALALNAASYLARRGGRRAVGARLTAASALPLTIGGFLGAHMAYARGMGVSHTAFDELITDWTPLATEAALGDGWTDANVHGLRVLAQVGEGHLPGGLCHLHPLRCPPAAGAEWRFSPLSRRRQPFRAATARYSRGPPRRPFRTSRRGLAKRHRSPVGRRGRLIARPVPGHQVRLVPPDPSESWTLLVLIPSRDDDDLSRSRAGRRTPFHRLDDTRTRLVQIDSCLRASKEKLGDALGAPDRRVKGDLERHKELIESRGAEDGGWRGEVKRPDET